MANCKIGSGVKKAILRKKVLLQTTPVCIIENALIKAIWEVKKSYYKVKRVP